MVASKSQYELLWAMKINVKAKIVKLLILRSHADLICVNLILLIHCGTEASRNNLINQLIT